MSNHSVISVIHTTSAKTRLKKFGFHGKTVGNYNYMSELHSADDQRKMIAEINAPFAPDLVVMDGVEAFVDGGPATGKRANGNVMMAATDRVAVDAVGVAMLKHLGTNRTIMDSSIFGLRQIKRAAELGVGIQAASEIELIPAGDGSVALCDALSTILSRG